MLDALGFPFEAALVRVEGGELLAADRQAGEAAEMLDRALTGLEAVGAYLDAERVRGRLARLTTVRRRQTRRAVSVWDALTATERDVVEEVCAGRSNAQVAERLGVSRRTVEAHLRSIYTKLDASTRLALAVAYRERQEQRVSNPVK